MRILCLIITLTLSSSFALAEEDLNDSIIKYRTRSATITLFSKNGEVLSNEDVTVEMTGHSFLFGCCMREEGCPPDKEKTYRDLFSRLFNYATLPLYWSEYERDRGKYMDDPVSNAAMWCRESGIRTKGHPLVWHNFVPLWADWQKNIEDILEERVKKIIGKYRGLIDTFDIVSENLEGPLSESCVGKWERDIGPIEAARRSISWAREQNQNVFLIIDDSDTSASYADEISVLKEFGFSPDAIGIKSFMYKGTWTDAKIQETLGIFGRFSIPIHFTGLSIPSGKLKTDEDWQSFHPGWDSTREGEKYQADEARRIYRLLFSCPSVSSITWWDFTDYNSWQGAPSGLLRKDFSPKPAYEALEKLIRHEWWTGPLYLKSDTNGRISFRGFSGSYRADASGKTAVFDLTNDTITAVLK
jgi:GH35 family endo-1,4-beta-xylanase